MNDDERPDEGVDEEPWPEDGPRSEGVRIIGAQEAAEAVGRPDVARRRRRGEKRFGDRPDQPAPTSDLPTIRISSSGASPAEGDDEAPVARAAAGTVHPEEPAPRWGEDQAMGHARVLPGEDRVASDAEPALDEPGLDGPALDEPARDGAVEVGGWPADDPPAPVGGPADWDEAVPVDAPPPERDADLFGELAAEDEFVLPHWTEPATGQVPKVVAGEDLPTELPATGGQPRWVDEGERGAAADFGDLVDDAPRLGALAGDDGRDDLEDAFFDDEPGRTDDLWDDEPLPEERPRRGRRSRGEPLAGYDDDVAEVDGYDDGGHDPDRRDPDRTVEERRPAARRPGPGRARRPVDDAEPAASGSGDRNLPVAVAVGVGLVAVGLFMFWLGGLATTLLACAVVGIASLEYFRAVQTRGQHPATLLGLVATLSLLLGTYFAGLAAYPVVLALTIVFGLLWYLWVAPGERSVQHLGITLLGIFWIGFLGSFSTLFLGLGRQLMASDPELSSNPGIGVLIAAVIASVTHDVGAYFVGRQFGRTPLSAASPNKTQEGLAGGFVVSLVATVVVIGLGGVSPIGDGLARTFVFALCCALVAPLGDLCESFIKRDLGIKDMGSVLPGHGGVLDRFDALLFVLPTAYFVTVLFDVWSPA